MALPTSQKLTVRSRVALKQGIFEIGFALFLAFSGACLHAEELPNPFAEVEKIEEQTDRRDPQQLKRLMETARRLQLHGVARRCARELLAIDPNDESARKLLYHKKFVDPKTNQPVWLDWFDAGMWQAQRKVRDQTLGYCKEGDRASIAKGLVRNTAGDLISVEDWDRQHSRWQDAYEVDSRYYHLRSTIPLAAVWYVADDLDRLTQAYLDLFEIERLPPRRFTVQLYRSKEDAESAKADAELLNKYGAYYSPPQRILHVKFNSLGGLTAARHEAAHALNREFVSPNPPQWFDEGIGVMCQFARPNEDESFDFGRFPRHGFGTRFVEEVQAGARERMAVIHTTGYVTTNSHYYSKFRSMVDFYMSAEKKNYRMTFINAMFHRQGDVSRLVALPDIDVQWTNYVKSLQVDGDWQWKPFPRERAKMIERVLQAGTSAVACAE